MSEFDRIIGYSDVKQELARIADSLKNPEVYQALALPLPAGCCSTANPALGNP